MDHPGISRSLVGRGARWKDARYRVWHRRSRIERSGSGLRWPNAGFIGEGVEKIDIGGEYGDQSEITAAARDKITPAPPIQIVYRETDRRSALRCPCGILPPLGTDAIRSGQPRYIRNRTIFRTFGGPFEKCSTGFRIIL